MTSGELEVLHIHSTRHIFTTLWHIFCISFKPFKSILKSYTYHNTFHFGKCICVFSSCMWGIPPPVGKESVWYFHFSLLNSVQNLSEILTYRNQVIKESGYAHLVDWLQSHEDCQINLTRIVGVTIIILLY